jgi:hypothetical protein
MGDILDLIERIRERPGMFLGRPTVNNLYMFLAGFSYARKDDDAGDWEVLAGFGDWVQKRYKISTSQGWARIIEFFSANEAEELRLFGKLFDEYLARRKSSRRKVS